VKEIAVQDERPLRFAAANAKAVKEEELKED
jgi:hypothetical protein